MRAQPRRGTVPYRIHPMPTQELLQFEIDNSRRIKRQNKILVIVGGVCVLLFVGVVWFCIGDDMRNIIDRVIS